MKQDMKILMEIEMQFIKETALDFFYYISYVLDDHFLLHNKFYFIMTTAIAIRRKISTLSFRIIG